ncbi:MAG: AEC family transporter [Myxococcota bacterium]
MDALVGALSLLAPILLGVIAGVLRVFSDPTAAGGVLNRYALTFAFPALMFSALAFGELALPSGLWFWSLVPVALAVALLGVRLLAPRGQAGAMALVTAFGNVAYIGIPLSQQVLGDDVLGLAALVAGVHVIVGLSAGVWLLFAWSPRRGDAAQAAPMGRVVRLPIVWAPGLGLLARLLPAGVLDGIESIVAPIGASAGPVALFLVGLYVHTERHTLRKVDGVTARYTISKLVLLPMVTFAMAAAGTATGALAQQPAQVAVLLSSVSTGIASFALAAEFEIQPQRTAQAFATTTLFSIITIPIAIWAIQLL